MTISSLIETRKKIFRKYNSIEKDREFTNAVGMEFHSNKNLGKELNSNYFQLIELLFRIRDKEGKLVPFFLNDEQKRFTTIFKKKKKKGKSVKILILKSRQQGFTTLITAIQLCMLLCKKGFKGTTVAHLNEATKYIFNSKAKDMYEEIPDSLKYEPKRSNAKEIVIQNTGSFWNCFTAGSKDSARSSTFNFIHGSERAFWKNALANKASITSALAPNSIEIYETTANGYNDFKDEWDDASKGNTDFIPYFSYWFRQKEYTSEFESVDLKSEFISAVKSGERYKNVDSKFMKFLNEILINENLEYEQIYWYFKKKQELKDLLYQEYPTNPEQAFLASGTPYFDIQLLYIEKEKLNNTLPLENIRDEIHIYEYPQKGHEYVVGSDVAEGLEEGDKSTFVIIDRETKKTVVTAEYTVKPDEHGNILYKYASEYNNALLGVERNNHGHSTLNTLEKTLEYDNLFHMIRYNTKTKEETEKLGWETTAQSKFLMLDELDTAHRNEALIILDKRIIDQMMTVQKEDGKVSVNGKDLVVALAIANQLLKYEPRLTGIDIRRKIIGV